MILLLMGVCGTGKTTIGTLLSARTGWQFADADDYHPEANRAKLQRGEPLTDEDRAPWLQTLHRLLLGWHQQGTSGILACSALKEAYREILRGPLSTDELRVVLLEGPPDLIAARLAGRQHAYMNPALLGSQLATLELPADGDAARVSIASEPERVCETILGLLRQPAFRL